MDFVAITSDDVWFKKHPEKIAGIEYATTSMYFPIMVKGSKQDVLRVTAMTDSDREKKINIAKAKAAAFLSTLQEL